MERIIDTIETIKNDIVAGKCVLILGPDLYVKEIEDKNWERKQYYRKLEADNAGIQYFEKDEVFSAVDFEFFLENNITDFFTGNGDIALLELVSTVRFPLILNASPDQSLVNYFTERGEGYVFDHFEGELDQNKSLQFDLKIPLIYNVFGAISDPQSLIITHDSLYKSMQELLPKNSFPPNIRAFLKNARSFIFLGFKFESWCYQLLSYKILSEDESKRIRMIKLSSSDMDQNNSVNIIMSTAMGMKFTENSPSQLLEKIIQLLKARQQTSFLRTLTKTEKHTAFLSYAHENEQYPKIEGIVRVLENNFNAEASKTFKLAYDNKDLPYGQSIDSFMTRIGKGKTVVLVVSDKYLKSDYCMIEAIRIQKYNNEDGRVFIILIEDGLAVAGKKLDAEYYQKYWRDELSALTASGGSPDRKKMNDLLDIADYMTAFINKIESYKHFRLNIADITTDAAGSFSLTGQKLTEFNNEFTKAVFDKMKED